MRDTKELPYIVNPDYNQWKILKKLGIKERMSPGIGTRVTLPEGWTFKTVGDWIAEGTTIYDDKGRNRIYSLHFFPTKRYVPNDSLTIRTRYIVRRGEYKAENNHSYSEMEVYDFANQAVIFSAGVVKNNEKELERECVAFLSEHFPDWKNPLVYWD